MTNRTIIAAIGVATLAGCAAPPDTYDVSAADLRERIVNGHYEKGSVKNFSSHAIVPRSIGDDRIEWQIRSDSGAGFRCESQLAPANDDGTRTRIATECGGDTGSSNDMYMEVAEHSVEKLIESTLTGKPYVKD